MCHFFSAIVLKNGDVLWHESTDSHSDLVRHFALPDHDHLGHFAKVEFTPKIKDDGVPDFGNVDTYSLKVDEPTEPAWFSEVRVGVEKRLRSIVQGFIVNDKRPLILGGCRILVSGAVIGEVKASRVVSMSGTSRVVSMSGTSSVGSMYGTSRAPKDPTRDVREKPKPPEKAKKTAKPKKK